MREKPGHSLKDKILGLFLDFSNQQHYSFLKCNFQCSVVQRIFIKLHSSTFLFIFHGITDSCHLCFLLFYIHLLIYPNFLSRNCLCPGHTPWHQIPLGNLNCEQTLYLGSFYESDHSLGVALVPAVVTHGFCELL